MTTKERNTIFSHIKGILIKRNRTLWYTAQVSGWFHIKKNASHRGRLKGFRFRSNSRTCCTTFEYHTDECNDRAVLWH